LVIAPGDAGSDTFTPTSSRFCAQASRDGLGTPSISSRLELFPPTLWPTAPLAD